MGDEKKAIGTATAMAAVVEGVGAYACEVTVTVREGMLPGIWFDGVLEGGRNDLGATVRSAIESNGFEMPKKNIEVDASPHDTRKTGEGLAPAVAMAILAATGQIGKEELDGRVFYARLSPLGNLVTERGAYAVQEMARDHEMALVTGPMLDTLDIGHVECATTLLNLAMGMTYVPEHVGVSEPSDMALDGIPGHGRTKRAIAIALAAKMPLLMTGDAGVHDKRELARAVTRALPRLEGERLERLLVNYDVTSAPETAEIRLGERPFVTASPWDGIATLVGGGRTIRPGDTTLADQGVLFMSRVDQFKPPAIEAIGAASAEGKVTIARVWATSTMPADFVLVGATDDRPEGMDDAMWAERCRQARNRARGLFELKTDMRADDGTEGPKASEVEEGVSRAWQAADERGSLEWLVPSELAETLGIPDATVESLEDALRHANRGASDLMRSMRLARAIADFDGSGEPSPRDAEEAVSLLA